MMPTKVDLERAMESARAAALPDGIEDEAAVRAVLERQVEWAYWSAIRDAIQAIRESIGTRGAAGPVLCQAADELERQIGERLGPRSVPHPPWDRPARWAQAVGPWIHNRTDEALHPPFGSPPSREPRSPRTFVMDFERLEPRAAAASAAATGGAPGADEAEVVYDDESWVDQPFAEHWPPLYLVATEPRGRQAPGARHLG